MGYAGRGGEEEEWGELLSVDHIPWEKTSHGKNTAMWNQLA